MRRWEGGWSNDKLDPGGLTKWGITLRALVAYVFDVNKDGIVDRADLEAMNEEQAAEFYHRFYWLVAKCDSLPPALALVVFDSAVNQGPARAVRFLQSAVGARSDGVMGPKTRDAIQRAWARSERAVLRDYCAKRALHYSSLSHFVRFGWGWFRRLFDSLAEAMEILHAKEANHDQ